MNRLKPKSEFSRNVLTLMTGTTIAQAISIAIIPILTRLYSPSDFGVFALYASAVAVLSIFSTGRYELAIIQTKTETEANNLVFGSLFLSIGFSFILFLLILIFDNNILSLLTNIESIHFIYLIPLSIVLTGTYQSLNYWLNRKKDYYQMSKNRIVNTSITGVNNISFGILGMNYFGLIIGNLVGNLVTTSMLIVQFKKSGATFNRLKLIAVYKKYKNFPKFDLPASSMNAMAQQGPNLLLTPLFGALIAGYYFLIQRVFMMPIALLSSSVASVFRQKATEQFYKTGKFDAILFKVLKKLFLISFLPTVVFMIFSEYIFGLIFGSEWTIAGVYARILAPMFMLKFMISPLTYAFYIKDKMKYDMYGQMLYMISVFISIFIGSMLDDFELTMYMLSLSGIVFYLVYLYISVLLAKNIIK